MKHIILFLLLFSTTCLAQETAEETASAAGGAVADSSAVAVEHVSLFGVQLNAGVQPMLDAMQRQGFWQISLDSVKHCYMLGGDIDGISVFVVIAADHSLQAINHVRISTTPGSGNANADYRRLYEWLTDAYDEPDWQSTVRSHKFSRWFVDFDRDIVLITTGRGTAEAYFYENHKQRNVDYYSILKYCEKNPADGLPLMTAAESVTWKRNDSIAVRKHIVKKRTAKKRTVRKRTVKKRTRRTASKRRRR